MDVEGEWASLKGKGGVGGRHIGVKLSFKKATQRSETSVFLLQIL